MNHLTSWGWRTPSSADTDLPCDPTLLARITAEHRDGYRVITSAGERRAGLTGKLRHAVEQGAPAPTVGDWVRTLPGADGPARIAEVLPRRSVLQRHDPGQTGAQVLAANVDRAFVVTSANDDFNLRRLERFVTAIWDGGVTPGVLISKADLSDDPQALVDEVSELGLGIEVAATSSRDPASLAAFEASLRPGETVALLGTSGVGKSTLVNALLDAEVQRVQQIRDDAYRGRHTTTHRQLFQLPSGALLIDTPGVRQLQVWEGGSLEATFHELEALRGACRFRDCAHDGEPGCAVARAIEDGALDPERLEAYRKLSKERAYLERRRDARARHEQRAKAKRFARSVRAVVKDKRRRQ
ncbi:MAG: ribosome small subunit-dependent GTPase A [Planctomycetota bacterium]